LGPNAKLITFRSLLTHRSGLAPELSGLAEPETDRYENLRKLIAKGVAPANITIVNGKPTITTYRELSANFALMRVLIPYLYWGPGKFKNAELMNTNAAITSEEYVKLVTQLMLTPSGITAGGWNMSMPSVYPTGWKPYTRHYQFNNMANAWEQDFLGRYYAGNNRWYLSVNEYCRFLDKLFFNKLLSAASMQLMKTAQMGMRYYNPANPTDDWFQKGGMVKNGAGMAVAWFAHTDEGYNAVLFVNTVGGLAVGPGGYPELQQIMKKAYDEAWVNGYDDSLK
jgi:CubicO group peptidase (beta-lactamase class C family)